jgi:hypothetical protein
MVDNIWLLVEGTRFVDAMKLWKAQIEKLVATK